MARYADTETLASDINANNPRYKANRILVLETAGQWAYIRVLHSGAEKEVLLADLHY